MYLETQESNENGNETQSKSCCKKKYNLILLECVHKRREQANNYSLYTISNFQDQIKGSSTFLLHCRNIANNPNNSNNQISEKYQPNRLFVYLFIILCNSFKDPWRTLAIQLSWLNGSCLFVLDYSNTLRTRGINWVTRVWVLKAVPVNFTVLSQKRLSRRDKWTAGHPKSFVTHITLSNDNKPSSISLWKFNYCHLQNISRNIVCLLCYCIVWMALIAGGSKYLVN